jgi:L-amino acid N-acyltransferase YncA
MALLIRPARAEDASGLSELINRIIERGGTTALETPYTAAEFDRAYISGPDVISCFVAIDQPTGQYEGFQGLGRLAGLPEGYADIGTFARLGGTQSGVGTALFQATRAHAVSLGLNGVNATIRADNTGGLAYYSRMGFQDFSVRQGVPLKSGLPVDRISKRLVLNATD